MTSSRIQLKGFTIVELLIVIVVIAILAAVTIVAYSGISSRARAAKLESEAQQITTQLLNHKTLTGSFPSSLDELNDNQGLAENDSSLAAYTPSGDDFCLTVATKGSQDTYYVAGEGAKPQSGACPGHLAILFSSDPTPTRLGYLDFSSVTGSSDTLVASIASVPTGAWMIVVLGYTNTSDATPPAGWTTLVTRHTTGTLQTSIYAKIKQAGDSNDQAFNGAGTGGASTTNGLLLWGQNAAQVSSWTLGSFGDRSVNATSTTVIAPAVTVATANSLVLAIAMERTLAEETSYSSVSGQTAWTYVAQPTGNTSKIHTMTVGYMTMPTSGSSTPFTVTYQNSHASNGAGIQLAIPPS